MPDCELGIDLEDAKLPERVGLGLTGFAGVGGGSGSKILLESSLKRVLVFG